MEKMINIQMNDGYLEVSLQGKINFKEYLGLFTKVASDKELPENLRVLGVDKGIVIDFSPEDVLLLAQHREAVVKQFKSVKHAYLVNDPKNTALAVLTSSAMQSPNYQVKIFATKASALGWLLQ
jgi:hypothetical protein